MNPISFEDFAAKARIVNYVGFFTLNGGIIACDIETVLAVVKQDMGRRAFTPGHKFEPLYVQFRTVDRRTFLFIGCDASFQGYQEVVP